jgi:hypothetical protein
LTLSADSKAHKSRADLQPTQHDPPPLFRADRLSFHGLSQNVHLGVELEMNDGILCPPSQPNSQPPAPIARSVPASPAVPTAATDQQENDDNDQKCRGIHTALLEMIMGSRAARPDVPTWGFEERAVRRRNLPTPRSLPKSVQY